MKKRNFLKENADLSALKRELEALRARVHALESKPAPAPFAPVPLPTINPSPYAPVPANPWVPFQPQRVDPIWYVPHEPHYFREWQVTCGPSGQTTVGANQLFLNQLSPACAGAIPTAAGTVTLGENVNWTTGAFSPSKLSATES